MKVAVLCGGRSPERRVSLFSGTAVANGLLKKGHEVMLLDIAEAVDAARYQVGGEIPPPSTEQLVLPTGKKELGRGVMQCVSTAEMAFLALHGGVGEDGRLQGFLECMGIPYTGSGPLGSMLAMDKLISKRLFDSVGIPTPRWMELDLSLSPKSLSEAIGARLGYPCVIKPASSGSSLGVMMAADEEELCRALDEAKEAGCSYFAERRIVGRELTLPLLGSDLLPPVEICPLEGFYDYHNKYTGRTREICPAQISEDVLSRARAVSRAAAHLLHLRGYARFDFMLDHTGGLWLLEANTLPGMTESSLFPLAARSAGICFADLCQAMLGADIVY